MRLGERQHVNVKNTTLIKLNSHGREQVLDNTSALDIHDFSLPFILQTLMCILNYQQKWSFGIMA